MKRPNAPIHYGSPLNTAVIACLQECFADLEAGDPVRLARWHADPYFDRTPPITPADADRLIETLDARMDQEIDRFPDYHKRRSGANAKPAWHRLPPAARLGLAQRLARVVEGFV